MVSSVSTLLGNSHTQKQPFFDDYAPVFVSLCLYSFLDPASGCQNINKLVLLQTIQLPDAVLKQRGQKVMKYRIKSKSY